MKYLFIISSLVCLNVSFAQFYEFVLTDTVVALEGGIEIEMEVDH